MRILLGLVACADVILLFLLSVFAKTVLHPPSLFDFDGFNEQYFLWIGCVADIVVFLHLSMENETDCCSCFAIGISVQTAWTISAPLFIWFGGTFQYEFAFLPFYIDWLLHCGWLFLFLSWWIK